MKFVIGNEIADLKYPLSGKASDVELSRLISTGPFRTFESNIASERYSIFSMYSGVRRPVIT